MYRTPSDEFYPHAKEIDVRAACLERGRIREV